MTNLNPFFLQKAHVNMVSENDFFFGPQISFFWSSKLTIFDGLGKMSELRRNVRNEEKTGNFNEIQ